MALLNALIGPVTGLLDKFVEDKDQKAALAHEISTNLPSHKLKSIKRKQLVDLSGKAAGDLLWVGCAALPLLIILSFSLWLFLSLLPTVWRYLLYLSSTWGS